LGYLRGSVGAATLATSMEILNTPDEIACWIGAANSYPCGSGVIYASADGAARYADTLVLELRKRIPAAELSGEPDVKSNPYPPGLDARLQAAQNTGKCVRVTFANGDVSEGTVTRKGDSYWQLSTDEEFGTDAGFAAEERAVSVEILTPAKITTEVLPLDEQLRLAAKRGQRVRVTMADGGVLVGVPEWSKSSVYDNVPVFLDTDPNDPQAPCEWCGAHSDNAHCRVVNVEILNA
jgi:hypothetical protein